jgi:group I intron endonuclease
VRNIRPDPCIYIATNLVNQKQYIGQTICFKRRLDEHLRGSLGFGAALKKYGIENFSFHRIRLPEEELSEWERFYIATLKTQVPNGYNIHVGGKARGGFIKRENKKLQCAKDIWRAIFAYAERELNGNPYEFRWTYERLRKRMDWVYQ